MEALTLANLRNVLIRLEETIIFGLIERAQVCLNAVVYEPGGIPVPGFDGCFADYMLWETEVLHARLRRYTSPDEVPFFEGLPDPILPPMQFPQVILPNTININDQILECYKRRILPLICPPGDDRHYGSTATLDIPCLQAISKRIHYGKFIAEAKFRQDQEQYTRLIRDRDESGIMERLTNREVEQHLLRRVRAKTAAYGRDIDGGPESAAEPSFRIAPATVAEIYQRWLIPMTKDVELLYLLGRK